MTWTRFPLVAALILALALVSACAGPVAPPAPATPGSAPGTPAPPLPEPEPEVAPGFKGTLKEFLDQTLKTQYASSLNLYTPPPEGLENDFHLQLNQEPATLILGNGVTAYAADENGLAMGFANGQVRVFGPVPCAGLTLPGSQGVAQLSWHSDSPFLAALGSSRKDVFLFDLRRGAQVGERNFNATVAQTAISPRGTWLAVADDMHTLWAGPAAGGPLTRVASLRYPTIGLSFSPQEGLMLAVDGAGWITFWAPLTKKLLDQVQAPFGPFDQARFNGQYLILSPKEGPAVRWNVPDRKIAKEDDAPSPFVLKNGVLTYRTMSPRLVKKVHMSRPDLAVAFSPSLKLIRVQDIDRETRFYSLDGQPARSAGEAGDYASVSLDQDDRFQIKDKRYALAERIFQKEHTQLQCRFIPGKGYYLWWKAAPRPLEFNPKPGSLPRRAGISADEPAVWTPVEPSNQLL